MSELHKLLFEGLAGAAAAQVRSDGRLATTLLARARPARVNPPSAVRDLLGEMTAARRADAGQYQVQLPGALVLRVSRRTAQS